MSPVSLGEYDASDKYFPHKEEILQNIWKQNFDEVAQKSIIPILWTGSPNVVHLASKLPYMRLQWCDSLEWYTRAKENLLEALQELRQKSLKCFEFQHIV